MEDHRGAGLGFGGTGCIRLPRLLQNGHEVPRRHTLLRPRRHQTGA